LKKTVIIIAGPTAVGKTDLAIGLAQHLQTSIVSADSRQCYKELSIGVAAPSPEQLALVPHAFIHSHSVMDTLTAVDFEQYALLSLTQIFQTADSAVVVGGTGLYLKALVEGLDAIPPVPTIVRQEIIESYEQLGISWLQETLQKEDPLFAATNDLLNPQRMMRALEVKRSSGTSILSFQTHQKAQRPFEVIWVGLELPRTVLNERIDERVDQMMREGLLDEVRSCLTYQHMNALQTVGYTELFDYLQQKYSLEEAIASIKTHTRQYAKRQMIWFKKNPAIHWFAPQMDVVKAFIDNELANRSKI
jgi:tRNA dimethylallyltransferase